MSAFVVDFHHINALVTFALDVQASYWNPAAQERVNVTSYNAEEIGRLLLDENVRSVGHRYSGRISGEEKSAAADYAFKRYNAPLSAVQILKAVECLEYQCCETDDWESTVAWRICQSLKGYAISRLPGYDAAAWGVPSASTFSAPAAPAPARPAVDEFGPLRGSRAWYALSAGQKAAMTRKRRGARA